MNHFLTLFLLCFLPLSLSAQDGCTALNELMDLLADYGECDEANATDLNNDGCTDVNDLMDLLSVYGTCNTQIPGEVTPSFSTITLNAAYESEYFETDREHALIENGPYFFEDEGTAATTGSYHDYPANTYRTVTFNSVNGIRVWITPTTGGTSDSNYFQFESHNYSQYDRLGIQVSDDPGDNIGVVFENITGIPWMQTSATSTIGPIEPWSNNFGGSAYNSSASSDGWIFPSTVSRAYDLGLEVGQALYIPNKKVKFIFYSDSSLQDDGWFFSIYTL